MNNNTKGNNISTINFNIKKNYIKILNIRKEFLKNTEIIKNLLSDMFEVSANKELIHNSWEKEELNLLWNMLAKEEDDFLRINHEKTIEVREIFNKETNIDGNMFWKYVQDYNMFRNLKYIPNGYNSFIKCAMILNEHYQKLAEKVNSYTKSGPKLINIANLSVHLNNLMKD